MYLHLSLFKHANICNYPLNQLLPTNHSCSLLMSSNCDMRIFPLSHTYTNPNKACT